jgi:hypothetical protein
MGTHVLLPLAVTSKPERKVDSLPLLGLEAAAYSMQAHLSDRWAKPHPIFHPNLMTTPNEVVPANVQFSFHAVHTNTDARPNCCVTSAKHFTASTTTVTQWLTQGLTSSLSAIRATTSA